MVASGGGVAYVDYSAIAGSETHLYSAIEGFGAANGAYFANFTLNEEAVQVTASNADDWMSTSGGVTPPSPI